MLDVKLTNGASDLVLMILLKQIICLVVADVVSLCQISINPSLELSTDSSCFPNLIRLSDVNQQMRVVQI